MGRPPAAVDPIHLRKLAARLSDAEIAEHLGLARVTVTGARKRFGIPSFTESTGLKRRDGAICHGGRRRQITFDEGFFSDLTREDQAYYLGLLFADGHLLRRGNAVEITLAEPDDHVLHDLVASVGGSGCKVNPRHLSNRRKVFHRLTLCSKEMAGDLISWGMKPGCKAELELRRPVPKDLMRHFIRGFWDGDGWIGRTGFAAGIQSAAFASQLASMIACVGGERPRVRETQTKAGQAFHVISVNAKRFEVFRQELYRDARFFVKRKHASFVQNWC